MARQGTGANVKTRFYLEGILVENAFVHASVGGTVGAPAQAQIELVPTNTIKHIMPGTWVHIFTTDPWDTNPAGDLSDFKLLFEGVVVARGFSRQDNGRNFSIQCLDPSSYWTEAKQFWLNVTAAGGSMVDQVVVQESGGYARMGIVNTTGTYGYINARLGSKKDQGEERFMDTLISTLDDIGGVNPFYANVRNRFRLTDRIIRGPAGKTSLLFELAAMSDFFDGLAAHAGGQSNLAEMVNQLLSAIMHEWVSVPAPPYLKTRIFMRDVFGNVKRNKKSVKRDFDGEVKVDIYECEMAEDDVVGSIIFKPHIYSLSPPTCNILFPNMYDQMSYQESFLQEPTRLQMQPQLPTLLGKITQGAKFMRPTELEIFNALVRDPIRKEIKKRTPDGKFTDGAGQTTMFTDYDWATNEERIRGINYNFINLAPAPSTLTLSDPGKRTPDGARKGGVPKYLQNVASYEYYKAKYVARQTSLAGPYNIRPVPGFSILALDDSAANMNIVAYLEGISHSIDANGTAITTYAISHPRLTDEIDLNRPIFKKSDIGAKLDLGLAVSADGTYDFSKVFEGSNQPPIPEWFDDAYRTLIGLDLRYREWFGPDVSVAQACLFKGPSYDERLGIARYKKARAEALKAKTTKDHVATDRDLPQALRDAPLRANDQIDLHDATMKLNKIYRAARDNGHEFDVSAARTKRTFTTIDQAFRFVGASPLELSDLSEPSDGEIGEALHRTGEFKLRPAATRVIDYKIARLDRFVGDTSVGSGYSGHPEEAPAHAPIKTTTSNSAAFLAKAVPIYKDVPPPPPDRMSGAFPIFDTKIHTGKEATDQATRDALTKNKGERYASTDARYDGRPMMFDFEFRLWQESLKDAGYGPNGEKFASPADAAQWFSTDGGGTRPSTAEERQQAAVKRVANLAADVEADRSRPKHGRSRPKEMKSHSPQDQAPTGDGLETAERKPLTQPLSEKQVVDLRRSIVEAYRKELASTRGFTG